MFLRTEVSISQAQTGLHLQPVVVRDQLSSKEQKLSFKEQHAMISFRLRQQGLSFELIFRAAVRTGCIVITLLYLHVIALITCDNFLVLPVTWNTADRNPGPNRWRTRQSPRARSYRWRFLRSIPWFQHHREWYESNKCDCFWRISHLCRNARSAGSIVPVS